MTSPDTEALPDGFARQQHAIGDTRYSVLVGGGVVAAATLATAVTIGLLVRNVAPISRHDRASS